jgi:hypothetical protein
MMKSSIIEDNTNFCLFDNTCFNKSEEEYNPRAKKQRLQFSQKKLLSIVAEEMDMRMSSIMDAMAELKLDDNGEQADWIAHTMSLHKLNCDAIQFDKKWVEIKRQTAIRKAKEALKEHEMIMAAKEAFDEPLQSTNSSMAHDAGSLLLEHLRDSASSSVSAHDSTSEEDDVVDTLSSTINGVRNVFFRQARHHSPMKPMGPMGFMGTIGTTDVMKGGIKSLSVQPDWWYLTF